MSLQLPRTMQSNLCFFFSSRRRHTRCLSDWSSDVCSSDLIGLGLRADLRVAVHLAGRRQQEAGALRLGEPQAVVRPQAADLERLDGDQEVVDGRGRAGEVQHRVEIGRSTRLNSSRLVMSYA